MIIRLKSISSEKAIFELSTQDRTGKVESVASDGVNLVFTDIASNEERLDRNRRYL